MSAWVKLAERLVAAVERLADATEALAVTAATAGPYNGQVRRDELEAILKDEVVTSGG